MKLFINDMPAVKGQEVTTFDGEKGILLDWHEPKNQASSGKVCIKIQDSEYEYYPSVVKGEFRVEKTKETFNAEDFKAQIKSEPTELLEELHTKYSEDGLELLLSEEYTDGDEDRIKAFNEKKLMLEIVSEELSSRSETLIMKKRSLSYHDFESLALWLNNNTYNGITEFIIRFIGYNHYEKGLDTGECIKTTYDQMPEDEYQKFSDEIIEIMWDEFGNICIDESENIDEDFWTWRKGTFREDIWHWVDEYHSKGVAWIMNGKDEE